MWFIAKKASQQNSSKVSQAEEDSLAFWYICLQLISIYLKCKIQPKMSQAEKTYLLSGTFVFKRLAPSISFLSTWCSCMITARYEVFDRLELILINLCDNQCKVKECFGCNLNET